MFYEVLEAQSRAESWEIAIKSRMQKMVHFENIYIILRRHAACHRTPP